MMGGSKLQLLKRALWPVLLLVTVLALVDRPLLLLLATVQGLTEFLPVSSTAHLLLVEHFFGSGGKETAYINLFLNIGSVFAILFFYRRTIGKLFCGFFRRSTAGGRLGRQLVLAFLPAALTGFFLDRFLENFFHGPAFLAATLALGSIYILLFEKFCKRGTRKLAELTNRQAFFIGLMQAVALLPGISRSLMTITAGLYIGLSAPAALEFSFLLGALTIGCANGYKILCGCITGFPELPTEHIPGAILLVFLLSLGTIHLFFGWLKRHRLTPFAIYRLLLASVILLWS